jgi:hypothetical protein
MTAMKLHLAARALTKWLAWVAGTLALFFLILD